MRSVFRNSKHYYPDQILISFYNLCSHIKNWESLFSSDLAVETFKETDANAAGWIAVVRKSIFAYHAITETEDFAG